MSLGRAPGARHCKGSGCLLLAAGGGAAGARMRSGGVVCVACSPRRPGINGSISGREGGALAATTASGSHYHRRQRLHRRRLDPSLPRRRLRPHPVPCLFPLRLGA